MNRAWVVRQYPHNIYRMKEFLDGNMIAIGWPCIGDLSAVKIREDIRQILSRNDDWSSPQQVGQAIGNIFRFVVEIARGDYILVPDGGDVYFGVVTSDYRYVTTLGIYILKYGNYIE